jgi:ribose transport system permease protein
MARLREPLGRLLTPAGGAAVLLVVLLVINGSRESLGFTWYGLGQISNEAGAVALAAVGLTFIVLLGGFDLSLGAVISVVNVFVAKQAVGGTGAELKVIVLALLLGAAIGLVNGLIVAVLRIPSIVATLAMSFFWGGVALLIMKEPGGVVPEQLTEWFTGTAFEPVPSVFVVLAVVIVVWLAIKHTRFGRAVYAVGGNEAAAAANGVRTKATTVGGYAFAGLFYGLAGVFLSAQTGSGDPGIGAPLVLQVFAAVVIGGTVFGGGRGGAVGSVMGAVILTLIGHILYSFEVSSFWTDVFNGGVLLVAVVLSTVGQTGMGADLMAAIRRLRRPRPDAARSGAAA